jgi:hypothetical protein
MMNFVNFIVNFGMMHQAMCPVKIGIVNDDHEYNCKEKIGPAMLVNVFVNLGIFQHKWVSDDKNHGRKHKKCGHGIGNFALKIFGCGKASLNFFVQFFLVCTQDIVDYKSPASYEKISQSKQYKCDHWPCKRAV